MWGVLWLVAFDPRVGAWMFDVGPFRFFTPGFRLGYLFLLDNLLRDARPYFAKLFLQGFQSDNLGFRHCLSLDNLVLSDPFAFQRALLQVEHDYVGNLREILGNLMDCCGLRIICYRWFEKFVLETLEGFWEVCPMA